MSLSTIVRCFVRLSWVWPLCAAAGSNPIQAPASASAHSPAHTISSASPASAPAGNVPGMFYGHATWLRFVVPEGAPVSTRAPAVVAQRQANGAVVGLDFDTGRPLGAWAAFDDGAHVLGLDGKPALVSECPLQCIDRLIHPGSVDGQPVQLDPHSIDLRYEGQEIHLDEYVQGPDPRSAGGYTAVRALAGDGSVLWDKVYLIDTRGSLFSPRDEVVGCDLVETASEPGFIRPGDDVAYLQHIAATSLDFGSVLLRVDLRTGMPTGSDPRIRAVDERVVRDVLQQAVDEAMRHDGSLGRQPGASVPASSTDNFTWTGDQTVDLPARLDWALHARFFQSRSSTHSLHSKCRRLH